MFQSVRLTVRLKGREGNQLPCMAIRQPEGGLRMRDSVRPSARCCRQTGALKESQPWGGEGGRVRRCINEYEHSVPQGIPSRAIRMKWSTGFITDTRAGAASGQDRKCCETASRQLGSGAHITHLVPAYTFKSHILIRIILKKKKESGHTCSLEVAY